VLVVPVIAAGTVVPCGGLMLRSVRHGRGGNALWMLLCPIEERGEADGRLSSGVVLRVQTYYLQSRSRGISYMK
jgi:hypothetical protein